MAAARRAQLLLGHLAGPSSGSGATPMAVPCAGGPSRANSPDDVVVVHGRRTAIGRARRGGFKVRPGGCCPHRCSASPLGKGCPGVTVVPLSLPGHLTAHLHLLLPGWQPQSPWGITRMAPRVLVPCHPSKQVSSSHQLRGHPCFFLQINGVAPFAGSCHLNLCSCVILKALQTILL